MNSSVQKLESQFEGAAADLSRMLEALEGAIVGQHRLITELLICVFAGGHVLMEGLPGLGKTHLAKALSATMGMNLSRVQCTPDLMPADITGSEILTTSDSGEQRLAFRRGPIFSNMVLVDEINRATPKTQAALLEAMQESQVTHAGERHPLPDPFWVLATQNPIEVEGTYPLPEAQLDRFTAKVDVGYPDADALMALLDISLDDEPADQLKAAVTPSRVVEIMGLARAVVIARHIKQAAVDLVLATQPGSPGESALATSHFKYGASPRGLQSLLRSARVSALLDNRVQVDIEDLYRVAPQVLRHRILLKVESELEGININQILEKMLSDWRGRY